jgi:hypothetical protein
MAALDFVVSHPSAPALNALPTAARTLTLHVPDSLDPYHQQQLRDALEGEFRRGCQALAASIAAMASAKPEGSNRPRDEFAARIAELQSSLEQSAARWLAKWSGTNRLAAPLPADDRSVVVQVEQEIRDVVTLIERARSFILGPNGSEESARQLGNELDSRLGKLSERLEAVLALPANGERDNASREAIIRQLLETIQAGHAAVTRVRRAEP